MKNYMKRKENVKEKKEIKRDTRCLVPEILERIGYMNISETGFYEKTPLLLPICSTFVMYFTCFEFREDIK